MTPWTDLAPAQAKIFVKERSRAMDTEALTSLVRDGVFELDAGFDASALSIHRRMDRWTSRLREMASFSRNATMAMRECTLPGLPAMAYPIAVLPATKDFREWFMAATVALANAWPRARAAMHEVHAPNVGLRETALWMACACMLDMPEALRELYAACPLPLTYAQPLSSLFDQQGKALGFDVKPTQMTVTPAWVAWQFSAGGCLDMMEAQNIGPDTCLGIKTSRDPARGKVTTVPITLAGSLQQTHFRLVCDNDTFERAIGQCLRSTKQPDGASIAAKSSLMPGGNPSRIHRIQPFLSTGLYERDATSSAHHACRGGHPFLIDELSPAIVPGECQTTEIYKALAIHRPGQDLRDVAVLKLVLLVKEKAGAEAARDFFWGSRESDPHKPTPFVHLVDKGCTKTLVALMDAGVIEPDVPLHGDKTPLQIAKGRESLMANVMASWIARRSANALLKGMDDPSSSLVFRMN